MSKTIKVFKRIGIILFPIITIGIWVLGGVYIIISLTCKMIDKHEKSSN
jgi:hypothetical protein